MGLGREVLERLLAADAGYAGPRAGCGAGHQADFASVRDKLVDTVLGPVTLKRAWYQCRDCGQGFAPLDDFLWSPAADEHLQDRLEKLLDDS